MSASNNPLAAYRKAVIAYWPKRKRPDAVTELLLVATTFQGSEASLREVLVTRAWNVYLRSLDRSPVRATDVSRAAIWLFWVLSELSGHPQNMPRRLLALFLPNEGSAENCVESLGPDASDLDRVKKLIANGWMHRSFSVELHVALYKAHGWEHENIREAISWDDKVFPYSGRKPGEVVL